MRDEPRPSPAGLTRAFTIGVVAAVVAALLAPLLIGSFTGGELLALVAIETVFLFAIALGALALSRRLEANREALWRLSRRDALTGVGNYRALQERLAEEISRHGRRDREFSLILIDLDRFKQVNEEFGHLEGDRVLAEIGRALREEVRGEDAIFRQGGDEFAVISPEINGEEAEEVAGRLRERARICVAGRVPVSAETGIASFPADGRTPDELLNVADRDLFGRKRNGRSTDEYAVDAEDEDQPGPLDETAGDGRPASRRPTP